MLSFDEARRVIMAAVRPLSAESVALVEARGRVAAEDIIADEDLVPYARSAMDGYAVRAADIAQASLASPVRLPLSGKVLAERVPPSGIAPGTAMAIATGAPVPSGADAVLPHEQVRRNADGIEVSAPVNAGHCIFPPAEDVRRGDLLLESGEVLRPAVLALLAFVGKPQVRAYRRPRVAIVCTGSELVDVTAATGHGQIRNTNLFSLSALVAECGGIVTFCGTVPDDLAALRSTFESAHQAADVLVTTGGASMGERDLVKGALAELGTEFRFRGVLVRPGKPTGFGTWDGTPVFVLPGNPAAAFVGFYEFVRPALLRLAGRRQTELPVVRATLRGRVKSKAGHRYVILARLALAPNLRGGFEAIPLPNQCSVLVRTSADANALMVLPEGPVSFDAGETVEVQVLDWDRVRNPSGVAKVRSDKVAE